VTPGARTAAVIALLDEIARGRAPADQILADYARHRRYIGAKDRRAIADALYAVMRRVVAIDCRLGDVAPTSRLRAARHLVDQGVPPDTIFTGEGYAPPPLTAGEHAALAATAGPLPDWAEANLPQWLVPAFARRFGDGWPAQAAALNLAAPVDLRVNRLNATREQVQAALAAAGIVATATPYSPDGLRLEARFVPGSLAPVADGWVEPQDEASQLVARAMDARPGMTVIDLCAGAGGKTLALAAAMENRGRLVACDLDPRRLARMVPRAERAGAANIDQIVVNAAETATGLLGLAGTADRVLVDAPCSGTGTWRRQPDARLRLTAGQVSDLIALQDRLIARSAVLTNPGGLVVYAVCSVLLEEGPERVAAAAAADPRLAVVPAPELAEMGGFPALPAACLTDPRGILLTPHDSGTDGFFVAALRVGAG
jgi:16S rRNA (cytosine967-C5)-methyltransferase